MCKKAGADLVRTITSYITGLVKRNKNINTGMQWFKNDHQIYIYIQLDCTF